MFENLHVFRMARAMAVHAGSRQAVVAQNIANADTPGYAAREITPFAQLLEADQPRFAMRATRPQHLNGAPDSRAPDIRERRGAGAAPNGNSVSLETEMVAAADIKRQHDRALAIYKSSLGILRAAVGRR